MKPIFYDPGRKRWKRLRRVFDVLAVLSTIVLIAFGVNVLRREKLPELLLPTPKRNYKPLHDISDSVLHRSWPVRPAPLRGDAGV